MKKITSLFFLLLLLLLQACGGANDDLASKKKMLKEKQSQLEIIKAEIATLEKEIAALDPNFKKNNEQNVLVTLSTINQSTFTHFIEVKGKVETDNNVILSSETPGLVKALYVKEGQNVGAGQVLMNQDNSVVQRSIEEVKTAIDLANIVYEKQKSLWEQKIGTEIQYLQAKNNKERLEKQLQTLYAQLELSNVRAPFSGVIDEVFIKVGQNAMPGMQLMRLVSNSQMQVVADVSEKYLGKIKRGDAVTVEFPSLGIEKQATVSTIGQVINPDNRTFRIEVAISNDNDLLKPDLLATIRLKNYEKENAITVPTRLLQNDKSGYFVYIAVKENNVLKAKRIEVEKGESYKEKTLINKGLKGNEQLIDEGFRDRKSVV